MTKINKLQQFLEVVELELPATSFTYRLDQSNEISYYSFENCRVKVTFNNDNYHLKVYSKDGQTFLWRMRVQLFTHAGIVMRTIIASRDIYKIEH